MKPYDYLALVPVVAGAGGRITSWSVRAQACLSSQPSPACLAPARRAPPVAARWPVQHPAGKFLLLRIGKRMVCSSLTSTVREACMWQESMCIMPMHGHPACQQQGLLPCGVEARLLWCCNTGGAPDVAAEGWAACAPGLPAPGGAGGWGRARARARAGGPGLGQRRVRVALNQSHAQALHAWACRRVGRACALKPCPMILLSAARAARRSPCRASRCARPPSVRT